ncbi:MAG: ATP-binding protein [Nitrospira sp.]
MTMPAPQSKQNAETHLQRTLNTALNELGTDSALAAIFHQEQGPLVGHASRGFTPRDVQAILRTLSTQAAAVQAAPQDQDAGRTVRLRLITPGAKSLLGMPLRHRQRTYGFLVIARKENATFAKKEKGLMEQAGDDITKALEREGLFDMNVVLSRPYVSREPAPAAPAVSEIFAAPTAQFTPELEEKIIKVLEEANQYTTYDRAWACYYDPLAGIMEVLGVAGDQKSEKDSKKDMRAGHRLTLDSSASGWAVRHRKPRVDHDLASTQGRFLDHKHLYKDRFVSSLVVPFFVRGQVGGTLTLGSREASRFQATDARTLEPIILKLADLLQAPPAPATAPLAQPEAGAEDAVAPANAPIILEPIIRKQERQAAIGEFSAFLATEIREPIGAIRSQLEEVTAEGILDFDPQTRVENAMRDLIRVEAILNEILDFAKPLELNRRLCRIPEVLESALVVVGTDLEVTRIQVSKDYATQIAPVRGDEAKLQQVFLSIFKNAGEAMTPGGHLHIQVTQHRAGKGIEVQILIKNDGAPIPAEILDKVFEPFFTTKRSGTGLGLATVKKIIEEHGGSIAIASAPGEGTTLTIRLPGVSRGPAFRHRGRGRRPARRPTA